MFSLELRIDWSEMDLFGHVNNVMFMKYVQASRVNFWEQSGFYEEFKNGGAGPILASVNCQFLKPLFYPGKIQVQTSVEFVKTTSFGLKHHIYNDINEKVAEANDVIVVFDFNRNEKQPISDHLREILLKHQ